MSVSGEMAVGSEMSETDALHQEGMIGVARHQEEVTEDVMIVEVDVIIPTTDHLLSGWEGCLETCGRKRLKIFVEVTAGSLVFAFGKVTEMFLLLWILKMVNGRRNA
mmetsp:Transcript_77927/g.138055  ORF Transcript_77927/g.138055 Transcript_77927/m.138055 type:complete len:107 (+) Transcript_77927:138-458(+)